MSHLISILDRHMRFYQGTRRSLDPSNPFTTVSRPYRRTSGARLSSSSSSPPLRSTRWGWIRTNAGRTSPPRFRAKARSSASSVSNSSRTSCWRRKRPKRRRQRRRQRPTGRRGRLRLLPRVRKRSNSLLFLCWKLSRRNHLFLNDSERGGWVNVAFFRC